VLSAKDGVAVDSFIGVGELRELEGLSVSWGLVVVAAEGEFGALVVPSILWELGNVTDINPEVVVYIGPEIPEAVL
jgi:hypothetical protein